METSNIIAMYKGYTGGSFLYKRDGKFFVSVVNRFGIGVSSMQEISTQEISIDNAKEMFQAMNPAVSFAEAFESWQDVKDMI